MAAIAVGAGEGHAADVAGDGDGVAHRCAPELGAETAAKTFAGGMGHATPGEPGGEAPVAARGRSGARVVEENAAPRAATAAPSMRSATWRGMGLPSPQTPSRGQALRKVTRAS